MSQVPNMRVYAKDQIPERFHFKGGRFVAPLTLVAEPGWFISEVRRISIPPLTAPYAYPAVLALKIAAPQTDVCLL